MTNNGSYLKSQMHEISGCKNELYFSVDKFRKLTGPVIDVRTPKEYKQGHIPGAKNCPLFTDEERVEVGTTYKKHGRREAVLLGMKLTGPKILKIKNQLEGFYTSQKETIVNDQDQLIRIYCWRGGMRSASIAWLANILGMKVVLLEGGYKKYRRSVLELFNSKLPIKLIGGKTGTGKTDLLISLKRKGINILDLEGLANHRGSSFGGLGLPEQPTSEHFENKLADELIIDKDTTSPNRSIWIEAESSHLGKCSIPYMLYKQMKEAPLIEISRTKNERIENLINIYSVLDKFELKEATRRINKRLGPQRTSQAIEAIERENWHEACNAMLDYYDKCYDHELKKRSTFCIKKDISGLTPDQAADELIKKGLIC